MACGSWNTMIEQKVVKSSSNHTSVLPTATPKPKKISEIEITDEEFNNSFHNVPDSSKKANEFALQLLGDKNELQIKDVSPEHIDKIIAIAFYADYPNREYTIEITDEEIIIGNILAKNFIIRRN